MPAQVSLPLFIKPFIASQESRGQNNFRGKATSQGPPQVSTPRVQHNVPWLL